MCPSRTLACFMLEARRDGFELDRGMSFDGWMLEMKVCKLVNHLRMSSSNSMQPAIEMCPAAAELSQVIGKKPSEVHRVF